ncbi:MAG: ExeM/NucH family extracellular endonuclease, partial [Anaerolineales bacterium]|nr:ExeM/NucH family extracellular endonuclease [Anaerolineales bacterium]
PQVNEDGNGDKDNHSSQRCPNGSGGERNTDTYDQFAPTPGAENTCEVVEPEVCGDPFTPIYAVQGSGSISPQVGTEVAVEGIVVGDFQNNASMDDGSLNGFHIQDPTGDGDAATSDGIFIYAPVGMDVQVGDAVRVRGLVSEYNEMTEIGANQIWLCSTGNSVMPTALTLPVTSVEDFEAYEGMLVTFPQNLFISEYFNYDRYGEIVLTSERHLTPTAEFEPGPDAIQAAEEILLDRITLDDGRTTQNPDPAIHPNGNVFDLTNLFRGGDTVQNVTGVMDYSFDLYRIQPTQGADYVNANPRPAQPDEIGGSLRVASFNVLNYFSTIDTGAYICGPSQDQECRGADTPEEFTRQRDKIIAAISATGADILGLLEIENNINDDAVQDLVNGLNEVNGAGTYDYVHTGVIGTDAIKVALIYKPASASLIGEFAVLDSGVDPRFIDTKNRPSLAQTFMDNSTGGIFTVVVNHLKSKGSDCDDIGDYDLGDGAGNCNLTRTAAAEALVDWLATDPTGSEDADFLIIGDLNSYDKEDPIDALLAGGYEDLVFEYNGEDAYSYVFDGQVGYLDHALALTNSSLIEEISGVTPWHINADEPDLIDYDMSFKEPAQDALYAPDPYRSSDHDPVLIGMNVCDEIAPTMTIELSTESLWPPNHKYVEVTATVTASDNFDAGPVVSLLSVTSSEVDNAPGGGDGNTVDDIVIVDEYTFLLRAERSATNKDGRIYTITYQVEDSCGNVTVESATVIVPFNQRHKK